LADASGVGSSLPIFPAAIKTREYWLKRRGFPDNQVATDFDHIVI
jgi:hypothetical protein